MTRGGTGLFPGGTISYSGVRNRLLRIPVYTAKAPPSLRAPHNRNASAHHAATVDQHIPKLSSSGASSARVSKPPSTVQKSSTPLSEFHQDAARSSLPSPHHTTYVQQLISNSLRENDQGSDSPVMSETLNVIDEHITDLSTPRQSRAQRRQRDDSESEYSTHLDRHSLMTGPETDEEDNAGLDEATVRSWDHHQTAQYLEEIGLDSAHCQIFKEQEITGDVLLDMDQSFIYMKEYDFGVMGRRLKTWHKVRDLQNEIKGVSSKRTSERGQNSSREDAGRLTIQNLSSSSAIARLQDRGLSVRQTQRTPPTSTESSGMPYPLQPQQTSKRASWSAHTPPSSWRANLGSDSPTVANSSSSRKSRRHSSIDFSVQPDLELTSIPSTVSHQKQSSWSLAGSTAATTPSSSTRPATRADDALNRSSPTPIMQSPSDIDRGYFSSNDADNRRSRNRLSKTPRVDHSRQTSLAEQSKRASMVKRHARISSAGSVQDQSGYRPSGAAKAYHEMSGKGRVRSASARATMGATPSGGLSPAVTNLENESSTSISSPAIERMKMQDRARKIMGFRTASDAITSDEKSNVSKFTPILNQQPDFVASPATGNTTPSATPSIDMETPEGSVRGPDTPTMFSKTSLRPRPRPKQYTSAYVHGLLKIPPSEARKQCDHHGWMKKKSSGLMTTWKPRLFILRGRRLSYYYSENDTEERGIIDISSHKVLAANDDPMITIHASVTGATKPSSTPKVENPSSSPAKSRAMNVFYFKLVPPKTGLSRAVQFTKPAIHYFQVDTIAEGRKWMGEIMKATIEHDLTSFETTNKQTTISLAKAKARRERPPDLDDTKKVDRDKVGADKGLKESGLNIRGLDYEESSGSKGVGEAQSISQQTPSAQALAPRITRKEEQEPTIPEEDDKENLAEDARNNVTSEAKE